MAEYKTCPDCGCSLDPEEHCDCGGSSMPMPVSDVISRVLFEEKERFVESLGMLMRLADVDCTGLRLKDMETVEVLYESGGRREINIACDSKIAIVRDVARVIG